MFTGEHRRLPVKNHVWVYFTAPEEVTAEQLSQFFYESGVSVPVENFSLTQRNNHVANQTATVLVAIPFESIEYILQWLFEEKRLQVPRLANGGWKITPKIQPFRGEPRVISKPKGQDAWPPQNVEKIYA